MTFFPSEFLRCIAGDIEMDIPGTVGGMRSHRSASGRRNLPKRAMLDKNDSFSSDLSAGDWRPGMAKNTVPVHYYHRGKRFVCNHY